MLVVFWYLLLLSIHESISSHVKVNFCNPSLCKAGETHIGCNNNGDFGIDCPNDAKIFDMSNMRKYILERHNFYRNRIASGSVSSYLPARRMLPLKWSTQLALLAALNVKRCLFETDECHNTDIFANSGQNLGQTIAASPMTLRTHLNNIINLWFNEHAYANKTIINSFQPGSEYGHFTLMVGDRIDRVGCASIQFSTSPSKIHISTTCNYASDNIRNYPVYRTSTKPGSSCRTGTSNKYKSLCSAREVINPNFIG